MSDLASSLFDLVDRIAVASSVPEVWDAYLSTSAQVGLGFGVACYMPVVKTAPFEIVAEAMPADWWATYSKMGLAEGVLIADRARVSKTSFTWHMRDWDETSLSPIQKSWYQNNIRHNILGGLNILDHARGEDMLLVICGPDGQLYNHDRLALNFAGLEALGRLRELGVAHPVQFGLSHRERECLQWVAAGKTDKEIGMILSLSEKTVNVYVERAKTKCGVATRAQAIVMAMRRGAIGSG